MINAQKLADFRASRTPISGFWNVDGAEAHGSLIWQEENAVLVLTLELKDQDHADLDDIDHPLFNASKPPLQPTITSRDPIYKLITLKNCFRTHIRGSTNTSTGQTAYELEFHITQIWLGDALNEVDGNVKYITISDERIAGIFGNPGLTTIDSYQDEHKEVFATLGNPRTIWTVHGPTANNIKLGSTGLSLSITTGAMTGFSARTGRSINTTVEINVYSKDGRSMKSAIEQIFSLEQLISTFSLEAFSFKYVVFGTGERAEAGLAWQIDDRDVFQPLMRHQVLVDLSSPEVLSVICNQWFNASATIQLSRWLFSRALAETKSGLSRFVTVSQAFEVIGREYGPNAKMTRSRIKEAADLIREVLSGKFDEKYIDRWVGLVLSSNKSSYKDALQYMIEEASNRHLPNASSKVAAFCKDASDTRNAVVHMTDDDKGKLTIAFSKVNKMSLMMCFWYAVVQAHKLGIDLPNIETFLYNNRNARHGLPNEILERAGRSSRARA